MSHSPLFQINDVVLEIAPENINIDRAAQIKHYKPLRTKGDAKVRSPSSVVSITAQAKFVGVDDINTRLRPLVAQFLLTPFCYVDNQYLKDSLLGQDHAGENIGLALQNLTISTVESLPDTWNVVFSFIWFNYKPYTPDFYFKAGLFDTAKIQKVKAPGVLGGEELTPFQLFYQNQLAKLRPVRLLDSDLQMVTFEFMLANEHPNPDVADDSNQTEVDMDRLNEFMAESTDIINSTVSILDAEGDSPDTLSLRQRLAQFQSLPGPAGAQNTISAISQALSQVKTIKPNNSDVKALLKRQDALLKQTVLLYKGNPWFELPADVTKSPNQFRDGKPGSTGSKLYFRRRIMSTNTDDLHTGLVATSITMNFNHKLAILPLQGYQYPTAQHLGSSDVEFSIQLMALDDESNRQIADFWNVCQNNLQFARFISQDLTTVEVSNELFDFMGVKTVLLSGKRDSTVPEHPELYSHEIVAVENNIRPTDLEQITVIPTSSNVVRRKIWKAIFDNIQNGFTNSARGTNVGNQFISFKPKGSIDPDSKLFLDKVISRDISLVDSGFAQDSKEGLNAHVSFLFEKLKKSDEFGNAFAKANDLDDRAVLGIEGLNEHFSRTINNSFSKSLKPLKFDRDAPRSDNVALNERSRQERLELLREIQGVRGIIRDAPSSATSMSKDLVVQFADGSSIDLKQRLSVPAQEELAKVASNTKSSTAFTFRRLIDISAPANVADIFGAVETAIIQLDADSNGKTEDPFLALFREWQQYAVDIADEIIDRGHIRLPIFAEAYEAYKEFESKTKKSLYKDMSFDEIEGLVKQRLRLPDEVELEPDFYFWNETGDGNTVTSVTPEDVTKIKSQTLDYIKEMGSQNNQWYKNIYLNKTNPELGRFIRDSNPNEELLFTDEGLYAAPGLLQIDKPIDIRTKSSNGYTKHLSGTYNTSVNQAELILPRTQNAQTEQVTLVQQSSTAEADVGQSLEQNLVTDEVRSAYGGWVAPMKNFQIRGSSAFPSTRRDLTGVKFQNGEVGKARQHSGTDLVIYSGGANVTLGQPVYACLDGEVIVAGFSESGGNQLTIRCLDPVDGKITLTYLHLLNSPGRQIPGDLKPGMVVKAGEVIGYAGNTGRSTGPHLHFEVRMDNEFKTVIYPFGSFHGDIVKQLNPGFLVRDHIQVPTVTDAIPAAHLPNAGLAGIDGGLSALDRSLRQLQGEWNRDAGYRMNRAYPSIYLAMIEEDLDDTRIYKFDDYFSFSSIVSMYCVKDREVPADYVMMELTNISGLLSNRKFQGTFNEDAPVTADGKEAKDVDRRDPTAVNTDEEYKFESLMLREGIKVELRLGYSNNPDNLPIVFVGRIVGVQFSESDDVIQVEMQSLATELVQDIKGVDKVEVKDGFLVSDARTGPLLESMIASPECVSFGRWKRGVRDGNTDRDLLTSRWTWNPEPSTDNIFAPPCAHLDPRKFFLGKTIMGKLYGGLAVTAVATGALAFATGVSIPVAAILAATSAFGVGSTTVLGGTVLAGIERALGLSGSGSVTDLITKGFFSALSYLIYQSTIWDVFKEMEHRHPDCIASPVPYVEAGLGALPGRTRMTMFYGNPDWLYFARDPLGSEKAKTQEINDRADALKKALEDRYFSKEEKWDMMKDLADAASMSDELTPLIPRMVRAIEEPESDENLLDDIDLAVSNIRLQASIANESITPFRKYHIVSSSQHIIANNIRAKSSNTFNAVTINYAESEDEIEVTDGNAPRITDVEELTMKLDPLIPDEHVREAVYTYHNCQGEELAKRYAVSHLQKGCWQIYQGDLVILGNPSMKPYDIVYVYDEYSDMYGPIQIRRVTHMFDYEHGFITIITPDLLTTISEGVTLSHTFAMGLAAEKLLGIKSIEKLPTTADTTDAVVNPWKLALANGALGIASIFGAKKMLFVGQFGHPVRIHPLIHNGHALVAGFGPPGVRENEFIINDIYQWFLTRGRAVADTWEDAGRMFQNRQGLLNTRGSILNARGIRNGNDLGALITGRKK
jgi:murein DD-endopeptidase MepM/ murein hydrolase activator NlpD